MAATATSDDPGDGAANGVSNSSFGPSAGNATKIQQGTSKPRLTEERLCRLEAIGFEWRVKNKMKRHYDKHWETIFGALKAFKEANGHCMVCLSRIRC
jgi:hypothetical protein